MEKCNIAVILTCYNRKKLTVASLSSLFLARRLYNEGGGRQLALSVYLTDDGCSDGTADAVLTEFPKEEIHIVQGTGSLYWAGGMRLAWKEALKDREKWDFYLLINDDTLFCDNTFAELMRVHEYACQNDGRPGLYSGVCSSLDGKEITYGGKVYSFPLIGKAVTLKPNGVPQPCEMANANILLISNEVVDSIEIFDEVYQHSNADWAYSIEARKKGFPLYITGVVCGRCDFDHDSYDDEQKKIKKMSISERRAYFDHPLRATLDRLNFMRKYQKSKFLLLYIARLMNIFFPSVYYSLIKRRPHTL